MDFAFKCIISDVVNHAVTVIRDCCNQELHKGLALHGASYLEQNGRDDSSAICWQATMQQQSHMLMQNYRTMHTDQQLPANTHISLFTCMLCILLMKFSAIT